MQKCMVAIVLGMGAGIIMADIDITEKVRFGDNDSEYLPLTKCACGKEFPSWEFILSIYRDHPAQCNKCGRKMYFEATIQVYEVR